MGGVANKASVRDIDRCIADSVDTFGNVFLTSKCDFKLNAVGSHFVDNNLLLPVFDGEGGILSLPENLYRQKADVALGKHFELAPGVSFIKVKVCAKQLCDVAG